MLLDAALAPVFERRETRRRSLLKTLTWRVTATADTFAISWVITGNLVAAGSIAGVEVATKMAIYYLHERAWARVAWGWVTHRVTPEAAAPATAGAQAAAPIPVPPMPARPGHAAPMPARPGHPTPMLARPGHPAMGRPQAQAQAQAQARPLHQVAEPVEPHLRAGAGRIERRIDFRQAVGGE